jgi:hypothetical protein
LRACGSSLPPDCFGGSEPVPGNNAKYKKAIKCAGDLTNAYVVFSCPPGKRFEPISTQMGGTIMYIGGSCN